MVPELNVLRGAERLGLSVYVGGGPGSGKTTMLRRVEHEYPSTAVFARAEPGESATGLLNAIVSAVRPPLAPRSRLTGTELDVRWLEAAVSSALDDWRDEDEAERPRVVLVDGADDEQVRVLFGRNRDTMWDLPLTWVVTGRRRAPPPPADSFFDRVVHLAPWPREQVRELIGSRMPQWPEGWCDEVASILAPATPSQALLDLQTLVLSGNQSELLQWLADERELVASLPGRLRGLYEALNQSGPTHAGDEWLLDALGVSRSRIVHGLKELESLGLLQAERDGRRVRYSSRSYLLLAGLLGSEAAGRAAADPARARSLVDNAQDLVEDLRQTWAHDR